MSVENFGSYQLLRRIATGGMAQIFLARQFGPEGFEKLLVVKRILPHLAENEDFVRMFLDEARIAARLNHPNIVQIFNLGAQADSYFIAMEYIHGEDVRRIWKRAEQQHKELPVALVCRIIMDACAGLDYAHKKTDQQGRPLSIVHRDVSPQNILVTYDGRVKVVDFGIAKATDQGRHTRSGVLKGKYSYMSPEQAAGKEVDHRSDIFALGVVLHELLTGTRLFKRTTDIQTLQAVAECDVPPPSKLVEALPPDIDAIVLKALAKDPAKRYAHAVELQLALANWLLEHQLPSSAMHLAAFMQELYADRLAAEGKKGQVILEDEEGAAAAAARRAQARGGAGAFGEPAANKAPSAAPTADESLERRAPTQPGGRPPMGPSREEARQHTGLLAPPPPSALHAMGVGGTNESAAPSSRAFSPLEQLDDGEVTVSDTPPQASRRLVLVAVAVSILALLLGAAAGFALLRYQRVTPPAAIVHVTTKPPGATVLFNGKPLQDRTPCDLPAVVEGEYPLQLSLAGYETLEVQVSIPPSGEVTLPPFVLKPNPKTPAAAAPGSKAGAGRLRVAVTPWAEVTCGSHRLGETPFPDARLPAGTYDCVFENPTLGRRTEQVEIRPGDLTKISVRF